jgi:hypothetical protein
VEFVVQSVAKQIRDRMLLYFDSEGDLTTIIVKNGRFVAFYPPPA